jgi:hypothetical protein
MSAASTRRVQHRKAAPKLDDGATQTYALESLKSHVEQLEDVLRAKRRYPGETAAVRLCVYLDHLSASPLRRKAFLNWIHALRQLERPLRSKRQAQKILRELKSARKRLDQVSDPPNLDKNLLDQANDAALALCGQNRLSRIKRCRKCGVWFFARFEDQNFCRTRGKNCRWHYYHDPEWRKKYRQKHLKRHREQNRRNQKKYRDRLFGTRGKG